MSTKYGEQTSGSSTAKIVGFICFCIVGIACLIFIFISAQKEHAKKEEVLHAIVADVKVDIENGDFTEAYLKADTIRWGFDLVEILSPIGSEEEWDTTRSEIILQIREAEINNK